MKLTNYPYLNYLVLSISRGVKPVELIKYLASVGFNVPNLEEVEQIAVMVFDCDDPIASFDIEFAKDANSPGMIDCSWIVHNPLASRLVRRHLYNGVTISSAKKVLRKKAKKNLHKDSVKYFSLLFWNVKELDVFDWDEYMSLGPDRFNELKIDYIDNNDVFALKESKITPEFENNHLNTQLRADAFFTYKKLLSSPNLQYQKLALDWAKFAAKLAEKEPKAIIIDESTIEEEIHFVPDKAKTMGELIDANVPTDKEDS